VAGRLANKVAILSGAANGQGRVAAEVFAREGAALMLTDMDAPRLESIANEAREAGAKVETMPADLTQEDVNRELVERTIKTFGKLDVLYHNAGRVRMSPIHETSLEDWSFGVENELTIVFLTCKYAIRAMLEQGFGSIINTASSSGLFGVKGHGVHSATKAGVIGLSRQIAVEYGPRGIRCNAIAPSFIDFRDMERTGGPRQNRRSLDEFPLRRLAHPEDPVNLALFLAADESSFITGQVFLVDGGKSAQ
jgi:NAD(P)-dependent dehydrogenase (short-subunit alcohol dehydrogenase family)